MELALDPVLVGSVLVAYLLSLLVHQLLNILIIPRFTSRTIKKNLNSGEWAGTAAALVNQAIGDEQAQRNIAQLGKAFVMELMSDKDFAEKSNSKLRAMVGHIMGTFGADARSLKKAKEAIKEGLQQGALSSIVGSPQIANMIQGFADDQGLDIMSLLQAANQMGIIRPGMFNAQPGAPQAGGHALPPQGGWNQAPNPPRPNGGGW